MAQEIRLLHGTLWHEWFAKVLTDTGIEFRAEVNLTEYLPEGWGGTADWLFWHPEYEAWVLGDLKTAKGEAMFWIDKDGAKDTHIWQLSAYWHALKAAGAPLVKGFGVMYWPMNDVPGEGDILPILHECDPIPEDELYAHMAAIKLSVDDYRTVYAETGAYLNPALADNPAREQKVYWNSKAKVFDLKLMPVWYERFCEFDETLCPRSGSTKIGHYTLDEEYIPRSGYEDELPEVAPTQAMYNRRRKDVLK